MTTSRSEHRTLSVLITLGVVLGAGLALASPAQQRSTPHPAPVGRPSRPAPSASAGPSGPSEPASRPGEGSVVGCDRALELHGSTAGAGLAHAIAVLGARCVDQGANGISNARSHLEGNLQGHGAAGGDHGASGEAHDKGNGPHAGSGGATEHGSGKGQGRGGS